MAGPERYRNAMVICLAAKIEPAEGADEIIGCLNLGEVELLIRHAAGVSWSPPPGAQRDALHERLASVLLEQAREFVAIGQRRVEPFEPSGAALAEVVDESLQQVARPHGTAFQESKVQVRKAARDPGENQRFAQVFL